MASAHPRVHTMLLQPGDHSAAAATSAVSRKTVITTHTVVQSGAGSRDKAHSVSALVWTGKIGNPPRPCPCVCGPNTNLLRAFYAGDHALERTHRDANMCTKGADVPLRACTARPPPGNGRSLRC
jgi:hypothetical protein